MSNIDESQPDKDIGLLAKFEVTRLTPSTRGIDHTNCFYFVLDPEHDPLAFQVLHDYAALASQHGYLNLAEDLWAKLEHIHMQHQREQLAADLAKLQKDAAGEDTGQ